MSVSTQILGAVSLVSLALWLSITCSQQEALAREWRVRVERERRIFFFLASFMLQCFDVAVDSFFLSSSCQEIFLPSLQFSPGSGNTISSSFPFRPEVVMASLYCPSLEHSATFVDSLNHAHTYINSSFINFSLVTYFRKVLFLSRTLADRPSEAGTNGRIAILLDSTFTTSQ